jgi:hypothetical protein
MPTKTRRRSDLVAALDDVESAVQHGQTPDDAITQVALERQLKVGETGLLLRAFNTGRTHVQLAEGGDAARADAPLADPDHVLPRLRDGVLDKAAELLSPTTHYLHNPLPTPKRATVTLPPLPTAPELPLAYNAVRELNRESADYRGLQHKCAEFDSVLGEAIRAVDEALVSLAHRFRQTAGPSLPVVKQAAISLGDAAAVRILDEIAERDAVAAKAMKVATTRVVLTQTERSALAEAQALGASVQRLARQKEARTTLHAQLQAAAVKLADYVQPPAELHPADPRRLDPAYAPSRKVASLGTMLPLMTGYTAASNYKDATPPMQQAAIRTLYNQLDDPAHENRLRGIAARAQLTEMLAADPVLQGYSGADVAEGYNALAATAPRAAESPVFMRGMLRRYLGQGGILDPDDVRSNLLEADKTLAATADSRSKLLSSPSNDMMSSKLPKDPGMTDAARLLAGTVYDQAQATDAWRQGA